MSTTVEPLADVRPLLEMIRTHAEEIERAKERLGSGNLIPTKDYRGAARLPEKTVEEMKRDKQTARENAAKTDKAEDRTKE